MEDHKHQFPISKMSTTLGVSRSGYYRWAGRSPAKRTLENRRLTRRIRQIWIDSGRIYGSPRIHRKLLAGGHVISRPRVARLMARAGIQSQIRRKWVATTDTSHTLPVAPNLLDRRFTGWKPARAWVSDITYLPSAGGWLYLTIIMDLADRQILGWNLSKGMSARETAISAFTQATARRRKSGSGHAVPL